MSVTSDSVSLMNNHLINFNERFCKIPTITSSIMKMRNEVVSKVGTNELILEQMRAILSFIS